MSKVQCPTSKVLSTKDIAHSPCDFRLWPPTPCPRSSFMPNEDLIYRITRAVYDRIGAAADEQTIEQLVTDIYREVQASAASESRVSSDGGALASQSASRTSEGSSGRMIISVFGLDHPGIVAGVAQILAEASCSIIDINQTVVQGKFAMVIIADRKS